MKVTSSSLVAGTPLCCVGKYVRNLASRTWRLRCASYLKEQSKTELLSRARQSLYAVIPTIFRIRNACEVRLDPGPSTSMARVAARLPRLFCKCPGAGYASSEAAGSKTAGFAFFGDLSSRQKVTGTPGASPGTRPMPRSVPAAFA